MIQMCGNPKKAPILRGVFIGLFCACIAGCVTNQAEKEAARMDNDFRDEMICESNGVSSVDKYEGSVWRDDAILNDLFADLKARRVGDIVTISVVETSSASNQADTNTSRSSSLSMQLSNLLGLEDNKRFPAGSGFDPFGSITGSTNNSFTGSGLTQRSGNLAATITARVTDVLPNGNLKILGRREITINNEKQFIALSGIIRPQDISSENVVLSTYISDARIAYTGSGVVNDRQNSGWLVRVLDTVWPF